MEYVYFFKCLDKVKIGRTKDVESRFNTIKTACPDKLENLGFIEVNDSCWLESVLHREYRHKRLEGEWFELSKEEALEIIEEYKDLENLYPTEEDESIDIVPGDWNSIRTQYEQSNMTLLEFSKKTGIKLGTLKSRKSREGWKNAVAVKRKTNSKRNNADGESLISNNLDKASIVISSMAVMISEEVTCVDSKKASSLLLDYLLPEWRQVIKDE